MIQLALSLMVTTELALVPLPYWMLKLSLFKSLLYKGVSHQVSNLTSRGESQPLDAWIYAGRGEINQENGKKALILGRDTPEHHCSIKEDWTNEDIVVRLGEYQTVYDIEWISVFCYNYSVDFAHLPVKMDHTKDFVPAHLPELRKMAPFRERKRECV
ncbi:unnamed protein product [Strongylus vulgaris]|uniref:DM13 domain-containing protein n=1 Tax=Strongylus vulgaris TaxID=40348 RepID=A0A3P7KWP3_STRVU|nr:unnamed protein product [Strongylus vulgaris]